MRSRHVSRFSQRLLASTLLAVAMVLGFAGSGAGAATATLPALQGGPGFLTHQGRDGESNVNVCSFAVSAGVAHCDARIRTDALATQREPSPAPLANPDVLGDEGAYSPAYLDSAYNVAAAAAADGGGVGQTVALVDAYDDPDVASNLAYYRSFFGLPTCPTGTISPSATGCVFEKISQTGSKTALPSGNSSWAVEISLDVEMVSAICPKCQILLVEANSPTFENLGTAVNEAVSLGANAVSNSYGGGEFSEESAYSAAYYDHPGVAVTVSAGDEGYGVEFPAASRDVTAVGGTSLTQRSDTGTRNGSESAWSGTGAGCSAYEAKPTWQHDTGCPNRTVADVSAVANPETGVWVYDTDGTRSSWAIYGGTSVASPIIASFYALAGNPLGSSSLPSSYPYADPEALYNVTSGSDGTCSPAYLCTAGPGYNGPTGLGSPGGTPDSIPAFRGAPPTPVAVGAPTNLTATPGNESVALSWSAPSTGTAPITYSVYRSSTSATEGFVLIASKLASPTYTDSPLVNGTTYYYKVTATNSLGEGEASKVASATPKAPTATLPGAPTKLTATRSGSGITLTWAAPASDGGSLIGSYKVYKGTSSGGESLYTTVACTSSTCTYSDTAAVKAFATYYYEVAAVNGIGTGPLSNQASVFVL